jgi:malate dehydrogenase (oxaloacetate-decarboxylating)
VRGYKLSGGSDSKKLSKGEEFSQLALKYAGLFNGKIEVIPKVPVRELNDFSIWYTPGVAAVSLAIKDRPDLSFEYTGRWNTIAVLTDGSRILGLGNLGPEAAMPVMEGKSLIFKYLGAVDAYPIAVNVHEVDQIASVAKALEPTFGGINLEDIASPKCFQLLDKLRQELSIPVWHDDQQGTAGITTAGLINALKVTGRKLRGSRIVLNGAGAANLALARLLAVAGADWGDIILIDSKGILHPEREDVDELLLKNPTKYEFALKTNKDRLRGGAGEAIKGADVLISASRPGPGIIKREWVSSMNKHAIVFLEANPIPEMWPWEAAEAGAEIVATGRSDFPNQINNSLFFPAVFRGVLEVRAKTVTDTMAKAGAVELAKAAEDKGLSKDYIIPTMEEWEVYPRVAAAIGAEAVNEGVARLKLSKDEVYSRSKARIQRCREIFGRVMDAKTMALMETR